MYSLFGSSKEVGAPKGSGTSPPQDKRQYSLEVANKTQSTGYRLWGWTLAITGRVLTIAGAILGLLIPFSGSIGLRVFPGEIVLGLLVCIGGLKLELLGRRYTRRMLGTVDATDLRDPVIYLRPFNADLQTAEFVEEASFCRAIVPSADQFWSQILSFFWILPSLLRLLVTVPRTEEEQLEHALRSIGSTVAVARPEENLPPAGFRRLKLDPTLWQEQVIALLRRARLVVLRCGSARTDDEYWPTYHSDTVVGGLGWEIAAAVNEVPPERLILLSPFNGIEYEDFRHKVKGVFPRGLPSWVESNPKIGTIRSLIWFDKEWNPSAAPLTWTDTAWRLDTRYPLAKNLREKFRTILEIKETVWGRISLATKRLLASAVDSLLVNSIIFLLLIFLNKASLIDLQHKAIHSPAFAILIFSCAFICYEVFLEASGQMATFGKRLFGLLVADVSSGRLAFVASLKRGIFKMILLPVGWTTMFMGTGRALHDHLAGSVVTNRVIRYREPPHLPFAVSGWLISLTTCFLLIWTFAAHQLAQASAISFPKGANSVTLDATGLHGQLLIPVEIKGQRLSFLLGSLSGETMIDRTVAARLNLKKLPDKQKVSFLGGVQVNLDVTEKATIELGGARLEVQRFIISPLPQSRDDSRIDGVIGYALLKSAVVVVDYPTNKVTLIAPGSFKYDGGGQNMPLSLDQGLASIGATLIVHGSLPAYSNYSINTALPMAITDPKCGLGFLAPQSMRKSSAPGPRSHSLEIGQFESIELGNLRLDNLGPDCCGKAVLGNPQIGAGLLKNFIVTLDYPHSRLILERAD